MVLLSITRFEFSGRYSVNIQSYLLRERERERRVICMRSVTGIQSIFISKPP